MKNINIMNMSTNDLIYHIQKEALLMVHRSGSSHIGSSLSIVHILAFLYNEWMNIDAMNPKWEDRDRFILSKGHAAASFYATLALKGFFVLDKLKSYCTNAAQLAGHVTHKNAPGVELSTGSLGHGLSVGLGIAKALKLKKNSARSIVLISDGELNEGSIWEAILAAPSFGLDNLVLIIDYNKIQSYGRTNEIYDLEPLDEKIKSFHWNTYSIDGHNLSDLRSTFEKIIPAHSQSRPTCIIANTIKGKGVSFMEDQLAWHYKCPTKEQLAQALKEIENHEK